MKVLVSLLWVLLLSMTVQAATLIGDARVVDGDTLAFEGLGAKVRLDGIDAPKAVRRASRLRANATSAVA